MDCIRAKAKKKKDKNIFTTISRKQIHKEPYFDFLGPRHCWSIATESQIICWRYPSAHKKDYIDNDCFWDTE